jgi:phage gpG-like protein
MAFYLQFQIEGEQQLSRKLRGISSNVKNWKPQMKKIGSYLVGVFSGPVFDTEGREIGEPWEKRKGNYSWPLLQRTGRMKGSFKSIPTMASVEIMNTTNYFKYHQSNKPRRKLPRRVMMKIDNERKQGIVKIIQKSLVNDIIKNRY